METFETISESSSLWDKGKLFIKCLVIFLMAMLLWIPTYFIMDVVKEREVHQKEAIADISGKWAGKQTVTGPLLMLPYKLEETNDKGVKTTETQYAYFMPDKLDIQSHVVPDKRKRGIYEVAVYKTDIQLKGMFNPIPWQKLEIPAEQIQWNEALLLFRILDPAKGINEDLAIQWNDSSLVLTPQANGQTALVEAFIAPVVISPGTAARFSMNFSLNGSGQLLFTAAARENKIQMGSTWPDPAFTGMKLPDTREVKDSGFTASWKYLNRTVPPVWKNSFYDLSAYQLGADLLIPVDTYDKTERSVKYALLCIMLTFAAFFLVETIYKRTLHLVQYGLAGLALVLFYTLLLSISEYTGFNLAYLISGAATIGLVGWYMGSILRSPKLALFIGFVLTVVYSYIFSIIQLQDYALLMGSIGLFVALGIIMFFSRKLEWDGRRRNGG
ncbi:MAG: cell envelope integrity protein CreD [Sphingobacteriales bacterium]|nr:cell envelope integrity protein CreD [Sphingobacteriales bacterium]